MPGNLLGKIENSLGDLATRKSKDFLTNRNPLSQLTILVPIHQSSHVRRKYISIRSSTVNKVGTAGFTEDMENRNDFGNRNL